MSAHLPVLIVVVPLLGGLLAVFTGRGRGPWAWACVVAAAAVAISLGLLGRVLNVPESTIHYALGDWRPEWGIEYVIDPLNASVLLMISTIALVVTLGSRRSVQAEIPADRHHFFYALWLLCLTGLLGMTATGDVFNVYVMLEISSLTMYGLIALGKSRNRRALTATMNYIVLGSIGASFILLGIGYLYMVTGTLNMAEMRALLADLGASPTVHVAFALLMVGLGIKMALFPFHLWMPNAYAYAPSAVSALLAATATKVGLYLAIRFFLTIFGVHYSFEAGIPNRAIFLVCGSLAIVLGSLSAIRQREVKKVFAYSSVAQIGYIVVGFALANATALTGSVVHILHHALMKGGLFLALAGVAHRRGATRLEDLRGLGRRMPWTMAAITAGGFGIIGMPLTAGFVSKWYLVGGALAADMWPVALVILIGSLLAVYYVWRLVECIYFAPAPAESAEAGEAPWEIVLCSWLLIGASIYFGIDASLTTGLAGRAASALLGG